MNALIEQCRRLGVRLWVEGGALAYDAPKGVMTSELAAALKAHKPAILAALAQRDDVALWWRIAILEPGGRTIEVDTPSGGALPDWQAHAERSWRSTPASDLSLTDRWYSSASNARNSRCS